MLYPHCWMSISPDTLIFGTPGPVNVLALAAHPDDVELCAGGTVCKLARQGYKVAIVDFTRGDLGSRGTPEGRIEESRAAAAIIGLVARENLGMPDGDIANTKANQLAVIQAVRRYRPEIVLLNAPECRHPDHGAAAHLGANALYYAGLRKVETHEDDGSVQEPHRPSHVLHYMQSIPFEPTVVMDVSDVWEERVAALQAFRSQFYNPDYQPGEGEADTFISNPGFFKWVEAQARTYGYRIGAAHGEPFLYRHGPFGSDDLVQTFSKSKRYR